MNQLMSSVYINSSEVVETNCNIFPWKYISSLILYAPKRCLSAGWDSNFTAFGAAFRLRFPAVKNFRCKVVQRWELGSRARPLKPAPNMLLKSNDNRTQIEDAWKNRSNIWITLLTNENRWRWTPIDNLWWWLLLVDVLPKIQQCKRCRGVGVGVTSWFYILQLHNTHDPWLNSVGNTTTRLVDAIAFANFKAFPALVSCRARLNEFVCGQ